MILDRNVTEFLEVLSSGEPVPGGGGVSAAVGACGVALGTMVGNLTVGKKKYAEVEAEIKALMVQSDRLMNELVCLADEDARAFEPLSKAYGLPGRTEEERAARNEIMEKALLQASLVPVRIMEKSLESMEILKVLGAKGSRIAVSDVGVGILFAGAALEGASLNVFINTKLMKDRACAEELNHTCEAMKAKGRKLCEKVYGEVLSAIR